MIIIQPFLPCFHQAIIALILNIQQGEFNVPITLDDQPELKDIPAHFEKFWVATDNNEVVGTIGLMRISNSIGVIKKVFVCKEYRGAERGIAQLLLQGLEDYCIGHDITKLYLGSTASMHRAHKFYEKHHFQKILCDELPEDFPQCGVDSVFYKKELTVLAK